MTERLYRVLVTGSRDWDDAFTLHSVLATTLFQRVPAVIVHGACSTGADALASRWAREHRAIGLSEELHPAAWRRRGVLDRSAGPRRNTEMVRLGADICLAFIKNASRGASHTADLAERAGIPTQRWTMSTKEIPR